MPHPDSVAVARELLRDPLIFDCGLKHGAASKLSDQAALDFLPRGLGGWRKGGLCLSTTAGYFDVVDQQIDTPQRQIDADTVARGD